MLETTRVKFYHQSNQKALIYFTTNFRKIKLSNETETLITKNSNDEEDLCLVVEIVYKTFIILVDH